MLYPFEFHGCVIYVSLFVHAATPGKGQERRNSAADRSLWRCLWGFSLLSMMNLVSYGCCLQALPLWFPASYRWVLWHGVLEYVWICLVFVCICQTGWFDGHGQPCSSTGACSPSEPIRQSDAPYDMTRFVINCITAIIHPRETTPQLAMRNHYINSL